MIDCETERPNETPQVLHVRQHVLHADMLPNDGGQDAVPGPHDFFDSALAACKALTAHWYAQKNGYPLERVETHVERDNSQERNGVYVLKVKVAFHGPLSAEQRERLYRAVEHCPIHKLMTTVDVQIQTEPLG